MNNKNSININLFLFSKYLLNLIPVYIDLIKIQNSEIAIYTNIFNLKSLIYFLKNHNNCRFLQLVDICGVDYINQKKRFEVIYNLLSLKYSIRIKIKVKTSELQPIPTVSSIFNSAN